MARDVQSEAPANSYRLTKVGVTGVLKPVQVRRPGRSLTLTTTIDAFVDLPPNQKGSHLSRNLEVINELVDRSVREPVESLEELTETIAKGLLKRHDYATTAEVWARADYFLERTSPWGVSSLEPYHLVARVNARRDPASVERSVGVEVVGMTACPCAMETVRASLAKEHGDVVDRMPVITHNQRNRTTLIVEEPRGHDLEADELIEIVEASMSAPTYELLKRPQEGRLVEMAHRNPKFVEDVVREILDRLLTRYPKMPDRAWVRVKSEAEESIHKHNAVAERATTFGELRAP
ncbi:MAG: GTP cyclohydrolase [Euryarchaeota archaeon RBG_16_67_27]|nr:MAG: GTP cyclohydrolase [Euryarchaeota archaeon RBG_16_67_27]